MSLENGPETPDSNSQFELGLGDTRIEKTEDSVEQESSIKDSATFKEAVREGNLEAAKNWFLENSKDFNNEKQNQLSLVLFRALRKNKDWESAEELIPYTPDPTDQINRENKLIEEITEAVDNGSEDNLEAAKNWFIKKCKSGKFYNEAEGKKDKLSLVLFNACIKNKNLKLAEEMIHYTSNEEAKKNLENKLAEEIENAKK